MFTERQRWKLGEACDKAFPLEPAEPDVSAIKDLLVAMQRVMMHHPLRIHFEQFDSARVLIEEAALWMKYADEMISKEKERMNAAGTRE